MKLSVGIVADDVNMLHRLRSLLSAINCQVMSAFLLEELAEKDVVDLALWLVVSRDAADAFDILCDWNNPQIFLAEDMPSVLDELDYHQWQNRLEKKLSLVVNEIGRDHVLFDDNKFNISLRQEDEYQEVWVIAASLGGPEAVKVFLSTLNEDLPIVFLYAQHIEESFVQLLPDVLNKDSQLKVRYGEDGLQLKRGQVVLYPSHQYTYLDSTGTLHVEDTAWELPYTPNINQVIDNAVKQLSKKLGVIVFSGMCDDSAEAAYRASKHNIPIWAQQPEECICSSMPDAIIEKGCVSFIGSAQSLAEQLNQRFIKQEGE